MRLLPKIVLMSVLAGMAPAYAQEFANPSLIFQSIDVPPQDFNRVAADAVIIPFEKSHPINWQITFQNDLIYGNPKGSAIVRLYDANDMEKYVEIGMDAPSERRFWAGFHRADIGYVPAVRVDQGGWSSDAKIIVGYGDSPGLSISNGKRIVVSNLNLDGFVAGAYSVHGMLESSDPPAINSGTFTIEAMSGDVSKNPFQHYPFYATIGVAAIIVTLLVVKRRS